MDRKDIFMSGFKSKIGYSFTYKDLNEFEAIIDFYEQQCKKQKEVNDKAVEFINENKDKYYQDWGQDDSDVDTYLNEYEIKELLNILNEVSEWIKN